MNDSLRILLDGADLARPVRLEEINFGKYAVVAIAGSEPRLTPARIAAICRRIPVKTFKVVATRGIHLTPAVAERWKRAGINAIDVELDYPLLFDAVIRRTRAAWRGPMRFHVDAQYAAGLRARHPGAYIRKRNDQSLNEDRVVLAPAAEPVRIQAA